MKCIIDPKIFTTFPGVSTGVLTIYDMVNDSNVEEITSLLRQEEARQKTALTGIELGSLPELSAWREIYRAFGSNPKDFRSSVESLLRRARAGGKPIPDINPLVNIYNYLSLKYHMPVGAEDLDKVTGDIALGFAIGTERGKALGSDAEVVCDPGEVIYKDDGGFLCRRWNWREADRTKIDNRTHNAIMVIEKVPAIPLDSFQEALTEAKRLMEQHLGGRCEIIIMNADKTITEL